MLSILKVFTYQTCVAFITIDRYKPPEVWPANSFYSWNTRLRADTYFFLENMAPGTDIWGGGGAGEGQGMDMGGFAP